MRLDARSFPQYGLTLLLGTVLRAGVDIKAQSDDVTPTPSRGRAASDAVERYGLRECVLLLSLFLLRRATRRDVVAGFCVVVDKSQICCISVVGESWI